MKLQRKITLWEKERDGKRFSSGPSGPWIGTSIHLNVIFQSAQMESGSVIRRDAKSGSQDHHFVSNGGSVVCLLIGISVPLAGSWYVSSFLPSQPPPPPTSSIHLSRKKNLSGICAGTPKTRCKYRKKCLETSSDNQIRGKTRISKKYLMHAAVMVAWKWWYLLITFIQKNVL